jgi:alpha-glucosidase
VIPLNIAEQHFARPADERAFIALPCAGAGVARGDCIEDDGESEAWRDGVHGRWRVVIESDARSLCIAIERHGAMPRVQNEVRVSVPASDTRVATCATGELAGERIADGWRHITLRLAD